MSQVQHRDEIDCSLHARGHLSPSSQYHGMKNVIFFKLFIFVEKKGMPCGTVGRTSCNILKTSRQPGSMVSFGRTGGSIQLGSSFSSPLVLEILMKLASVTCLRRLSLPKTPVPLILIVMMCLYIFHFEAVCLLLVLMVGVVCSFSNIDVTATVTAEFLMLLPCFLLHLPLPEPHKGHSSLCGG